MTTGTRESSYHPSTHPPHGHLLLSLAVFTRTLPPPPSITDASAAASRHAGMDGKRARASRRPKFVVVVVVVVLLIDSLIVDSLPHPLSSLHLNRLLVLTGGHTTVPFLSLDLSQQVACQERRHSLTAFFPAAALLSMLQL